MANIPKNPRSNCYFECRDAGPLHHFPKLPNDKERFDAWKAVLNDDIQAKGDMYIYNQIRLCNKHFESYYISPSNRLTRNAVPSLYIKKDISRPFSLSSKEMCIESTATVVKDMSHPSTSTEMCIESTPTVVQNTKGSIKRKFTKGPIIQKDRLIKRLEQKVLNLTQKCKTQTKKIQAAKKISEAKPFLKIIETMPNSLKTFMTMQLKSKQKAKGRKFTLDEKIMAASIMKQSQKGYNFLRKLLVLPSKRTIQRLLIAFKIKPGINNNIMKNLKEMLIGLPPEKRLYSLLFDEIALSPGLYYNNREIIGFEDIGNKKSQNIANHALVIMIKGIKSKTKQPILFTFCKNTTKKYDLKNVIIKTIRELREAGVIIVATICDQATTNVSTIKILMKETAEKYLRNGEEYKSNAFEIDNQKVFPLFDTPHLLKGVRNNFMKKNIRYIQENKTKIAKWEHLRLLLNEDKGEDEVRILNKLTEYHIDPDKIPKMKVKYAAQVFSTRVSAVMRFLAKRNILPAECEDTADLLLIFDKLFDSFNGHSYCDTAKVLKGCLKNNSKHFQFWDEILPILRTIQFKKVMNRDGPEMVIYEKVPSIQNWIHNINTFKELWKHVNKEFKINKILTRNFNQDPLENFFCCIRSNGIRNINPTCMQFMNAYKTLLINNMYSSHSINANCEKDDYQPLQSMKCLLLEKCVSEEPADFACEIDSLIISMNEIISNYSILHEEAKKYVAGYVIKKCKTKIFKGCGICMNDLIKFESDQDSFNYMIDYTKKSLFNARNDFINLLNDIYFMIVTCLRDSPEITNLKDKIVFFINCRCDFSLITCKKHREVLVDYLINLSINLIVYSWCRSVNRILIGKIVDFDSNDKVKLQAFNYNKCRKKKK